MRSTFDVRYNTLHYQLRKRNMFDLAEKHHKACRIGDLNRLS
jgi:hypothetical protein